MLTGGWCQHMLTRRGLARSVNVAGHPGAQLPEPTPPDRRSTTAKAQARGAHLGPPRSDPRDYARAPRRLPEGRAQPASGLTQVAAGAGIPRPATGRCPVHANPGPSWFTAAPPEAAVLLRGEPVPVVRRPRPNATSRHHRSSQDQRHRINHPLRARWLAEAKGDPAEISPHSARPRGSEAGLRARLARATARKVAPEGSGAANHRRSAGMPGWPAGLRAVPVFPPWQQTGEWAR